MRRIVFLSLIGAGLVACSNDSTAPVASSDQQVTDFIAATSGSALTLAGGYDGDLYQLRLFHGLPDELKLTDAQEAQIKALVEAYNQSTMADRKALDDILRAAKQAIHDKKSAAEVKAILDQAAPIAARLAIAGAKLKTDIDGVLTEAQRAWLAAHAPKNCKKGSFPALTDAQKAQMKAYEQAFEQANQADLETIKTGLDNIRKAIAAGKTPAEIQAIFDSIKTALDHVAAARAALHTQLESVLTDAQKASGCLPLG